MSARSWGELYLDTQVDRAWLDLRLELAEHFEAALASDEPEPLDITAPSGETLTALVEDGFITIFAGDETYTSGNVDEAAFTVFQVLHEDWQVVHPAFLDSGIVEGPVLEEPTVAAPVVPVLGMAESQEQLQAWVEATFQEGRTEPLRIAPGGRIYWSTRGGGRVTVRVRNAVRVELSAVVARNVSFKKAHAVIDDLATRLFGLKLFLVQDTLMMSQIIIANPYAPDQVRNALRTFSADLDKLNEWVPEQVLRKRVRRERDQVAKAEKAQAEAEQAAADALAERDAARTELAALQRRLNRFVGLYAKPEQLTLEDID